MKPIKRYTEFLVTGVLAALISMPSYAEFDKRIYVGINGGVSFLEPDPDVNTTQYENDDDSDTAGKVYLGYDFSERWGVEAYFASLGDATLKARAGQSPIPTEGSISYEIPGLSVLYHLYNSQGSSGREDRSGLGLFLRAGVGQLDTSSDDLEVEQQEDLQLNLGLGAEYGLGRHLAARAELEYFDKDAQMATLGLLWRFGGGKRGFDVVGVPSTDNIPGVASSASDVSDPLDSDSDGVANAMDSCPDTTAGLAVNDRGCPKFDGPIAGVNFRSGSGELTPEATIVLDRVAQRLSGSPDTRVAIMAHTDNQGSAASNLELSKLRAVSVAKYLVANGVSTRQIRPEAYGESRPLVSNATPEGRRQNRRIELRTLN